MCLCSVIVSPASEIQQLMRSTDLSAQCSIAKNSSYPLWAAEGAWVGRME